MSDTIEFVIVALVLISFLPLIFGALISVTYIFKNRNRQFDSKEITKKVRTVQFIELPSAIIAFIIALLLDLGIWSSLLVLFAGIVLIFIHGIYLHYKFHSIDSRLSVLRENAVNENNDLVS